MIQYILEYDAYEEYKDIKKLKSSLRTLKKLKNLETMEISGGDIMSLQKDIDTVKNHYEHSIELINNYIEHETQELEKLKEKWHKEKNIKFKLIL